jgi:hypothetical protein
MAAAMIQGLAPGGRSVGAEDVVVARGTVVVVAEAVAVDAEKARTRFDDGANKRPAPMDGVGK